MLISMAAILVAATVASPVHAVTFLQATFPQGEFGFSVADAGDVNRDGWPDLIVGAPMDNTRGLEAGRAFLWLGGPTLKAAPDLIFDDAIGLDRFGYAVAGIGDVNDDGYDDVAVGAPFNDTTGAEAGAVLIYYGGSRMNDGVDLALGGEIAGDNFGWSISRGVDLNGDDIDDFVVGAPYANAPSQDNGAAYLFLGSSGSVSNQPAQTFTGEIGLDNFGWDVCDVPDFRGDGVPSILIGAPHFGLNAGRAYLFYGASNGTPDATPDVVFPNTVGNEQYGFAVSRIGSFNSSSRTDVAIGAPGAYGDRGYVRVFYGSANPPAQPSHNQLIGGEDGGDRFGASITDVENFDGSGRDDFVVGAPGRDDPSADAGHLYLFSGGSSYTNASQGDRFVPTNPGGNPANDMYGTSISTTNGDLDGDGRSDLIAGSPFGNNSSGTVTGVAALLGSGSGIVPVASIPFRMSAGGFGEWILSFGGLAARAEGARLFTASGDRRLLAELGDGLALEGDALVATLPEGELAGVTEVELVLTVDGTTIARSFTIATLPARAVLHRAWPNPFNPTTQLRFELSSPAAFELYVLDSRGRRIRTLDRGDRGPGSYEVIFDGRDDMGRLLASGAYRAVLQTDTVRRTTSLLLLK
jgi:hypothetical protein